MSNGPQESNERSGDGRPSRTQVSIPQPATRSNAFAATSFLTILLILSAIGTFAATRSVANDSAAPSVKTGEKDANAASNADADAVDERLTEIVKSVEGSIAAKKEELRSRRNIKENSLPVKWLPDLKVLAGAPATTLELDDALQQLCDDGYFGGKPGSVSPNDVELSIISGGGEVASPTLEGQTLRVDWNPDSTGKTKFIVKGALKTDQERAAFVSFNAESWTPNYWAIGAAVLGGLGIFLLGMKKMSDGLQAIAGARLRRLVSLFTNNRFLAIGVGILTTTLVQSSSATTVMVLGFVNSGLMTLAQGIGVIMGTNIGTTTTGWLLTLNVGALGLPILGVGAFFYLFSKNERIRNVSTFGLGLGMIFFGLKTMSSGLAPLPEVPEFTEIMRSFEATSLFGAFKCVLIGCVTTVLVQSSAATIGITMTLTSLGAIEFNSAAALVLGENIGTTITALLASIGAAPNARRAAYFHTLFNVCGVCWALAIFFPVLLPLVNNLGESFHLDDNGKIALTHSLFNVANTILFIPLIYPAAGFLRKYVKETSTEPKRPSATGLASFRNDEPIIGIERSRIEIQRMFLDCRTLVDHLKALKEGNFEDRSLIDKSFKIEQKLDDAQDETIDFISQLTARAFTADFAAAAREQVRVAEELETISDYLTGVIKSNLKLKDVSLELPAPIDVDFNELLQYVDDSIGWIGTIFERQSSRDRLVPEMTERRNRYVARAKEIREEFLRTMFDERLDPLVIVAVDYQMNAWRRIYEHLQNIAEAMEPRIVKTVKNV